MSRGGHIDTLISEVGKRRILWDMRDKNYHNRYAVDEEWSQVAKVVEMNSNEAKAKWKSLRDSFRRELKKMPAQREPEGKNGCKPWRSKWVYFDSMLFLRDVMKFKDSHGNDIKTASRHSSDYDSDNSNDYKKHHHNGKGASFGKPQTFDYASRLDEDFVTLNENAAEVPRSSRHVFSKKRKRRSNGRIDELERMILELKKRKLHQGEDAEDDDDLSFFKSLLPYIRRLPPLKKLQIRSQYQAILINEIREMESKDNVTASAFSNFAYPSSSSVSSSTATACPVASRSSSPSHYAGERDEVDEETAIFHAPEKTDDTRHFLDSNSIFIKESPPHFSNDSS